MPCKACDDRLDGPLCERCQMPTLTEYRRARARYRRVALVLRNSVARGTSHLVLIVLAHHADKAGACSLTVPEIMRASRCGESTVKRSLMDLIRLGEVVKTRAKGRGIGNLYAVTLIRPFKLNPLSIVKGVQSEPPLHRDDQGKAA